MATRGKCTECGAKFEGRGKYCLNCIASVSTKLDPMPPRGARAPSLRPRGEGPICPHCKAELAWDSLGSSEIEISIYVREKMYFCPGCRSVLGFSSWHTEG